MALITGTLSHKYNAVVSVKGKKGRGKCILEKWS
jgi:hypothetical protein